MHPARVFAIGAGVALVGLVLLVVEVARTLGSSALGGTGEILLWVGLGLFVVGAALLTVAAVRSARDNEPDPTSSATLSAE